MEETKYKPNTKQGGEDYKDQGDKVRCGQE